MPKPPFNPNAPFEQVKPPFDPNAEFEVLDQHYEESSDDQGGAGQAMLEHFGDAAALGYLPHIQSFVEGLLPNPNSDADAKLKAQGFKLPNEPGYVDRRDANAKRIAAEGEAHPYASLAGTGLGILGSGAMAASLAPAQAATTLGRLKQARDMGLIMGAAQNPGDVEGEIDPLQLMGRATNSVIGGVAGVGGQAVAEYAPGALRGFQGKINNFAENRAFKAFGPMKKQVVRAHAGDRINSIGRTALDEGLFDGLPKSYRGLEEAAAEAASKRGAQVDQIVKEIDQASKNIPGIMKSGESAAQVGVNRQAIAKAVYEDLKMSPGVPGANSHNQKLTALIEEFENGGASHIPVGENEALKRELGDNIMWKRNPGTDIPLDEQVRRSLYSKTRQGTEDAAAALEGMVGTQNSGSFREAKNTYGNLKEASDIAKNKADAQLANNFLGLGDKIVGGAGAIIGGTQGDGWEDRIKNATIGAGVALGSRMAKTTGNQVLAKGANSLAQKMAMFPKLAEIAKRNPSMVSELFQQLESKAQGVGSFVRDLPSIKDPAFIQRIQENPELLEQIKNPELKAKLQEKLNRDPASEKIMSPQEAQNQFIKGNQ